MGILNPVVSKFNITVDTPQEIYICPSGKSHAIVDLTFYKEDTTNDATVAVALTTESNPANLTSVNYFIDKIRLIGTNNTTELHRVIVGQNERLYVKVISGPDIIVRLSGVEENNTKILKAGCLAAISVSDTTQTQIYTNTVIDAAYIVCSMSIFNTSNSLNANAEVWISTSNTPSISDKVLKIQIPFQDMTILENIILTPNEKIFVKSDITNMEYFINGIVISS